LSSTTGNDEDALRILKNCRHAIPAYGKLLLLESVLKPGNQPYPARFNDITMLTLAPGGRERRCTQYLAVWDYARREHGT
jgi:hypothetical protein